jgi:hypothetical protein
MMNDEFWIHHSAFIVHRCLQHREAAAKTFAAETLVKLALLGFVATADDDLVKLK